MPYDDDDDYYNDDEWCRACDGGYLIHKHECKPRSIFTGAPEDIYLGVELEIETYSRDDNEYVASELSNAVPLNRIYFKNDGSLAEGFEIVTHPLTLEKHRELWSDMTNAFNLLNADKYLRKLHDECGLHVHIGYRNCKQIEKQELVAKRMMRFLAYNLEFTRIVARRRENTWCEIDSADDIYSHYMAVNIQSYYTIELRIFKSSYNKDEIIAAIEFAHALYRYCSSRELPREERGYQKFINWLFTDQYPTLINYLRMCGYKAEEKEKEVGA